jgi:truncated hemoglobin YjbI
VVSHVFQFASFCPIIIRKSFKSSRSSHYCVHKVVQRVHPQLPVHPILAAAWVDLMSEGAGDAASQPAKALAIMQALWASTKHPDLRVRNDEVVTCVGP